MNIEVKLSEKELLELYREKKLVVNFELTLNDSPSDVDILNQALQDMRSKNKIKNLN